MIYSCNPRVDLKTNSKQVCTKFVKGDKEISLSCDNSCGVLEDLERSDIRCYNNAENIDVTNNVFPKNGGVVSATIENFDIAWKWLNS